MPPFEDNQDTRVAPPPSSSSFAKSLFREAARGLRLLESEKLQQSPVDSRGRYGEECQEQCTGAGGTRRTRKEMESIVRQVINAEDPALFSKTKKELAAQGTLTNYCLQVSLIDALGGRVEKMPQGGKDLDKSVTVELTDFPSVRTRDKRVLHDETISEGEDESVSFGWFSFSSLEGERVAPSSLVPMGTKFDTAKSKVGTPILQSAISASFPILQDEPQKTDLQRSQKMDNAKLLGILGGAMKLNDKAPGNKNISISTRSA